jgi:hypothetical protein
MVVVMNRASMMTFSLPRLLERGLFCIPHRYQNGIYRNQFYPPNTFPMLLNIPKSDVR